MLDTNICIYVVKTYPPGLREKFNALVEQLCISPVTLGELHYGAEQSPRRVQNLTAIQHFVARLEVLPFADKAAAHNGQPSQQDLRLRGRMTVQFIKTPNGDELAVLPRAEYERLAALAAEAEEDAGAVRIFDRKTRDLDEGRDIVIPLELAHRIADGENPILVLRDWRGLTQVTLAKAAGISQSYLADIESGRRTGSAKKLAAIAAALKVPLDLLV